MITAFDKVLAAILPPALAWLNQKYGFHIDTSPENMTIIIGFLSSIAVYFVPNKVA